MFILNRPVCRAFGCTNRAMQGSAYCDQHNTTKAGYKPARYIGTEQQGFYGGSRWRKTSANKLKQTPYCERCYAAGKLTPAFLVHHVIPLVDGGAQYDNDNLQSLCPACHAETHAEIDKQRV